MNRAPVLEDFVSVSVVQGVAQDRGKHVYLATPPQRLTVREMRRSSGAPCGALGDPGCPLNAPDAYPFHTISLCVTNSGRSANGNG